jgi:hypothetical protein
MNEHGVEKTAIVDRWQQERAERVALADRLASEYLPDLPEHVADRTFALAWEHGHASGESEVENYYIDFADLAVTAFHEGKASVTSPGDAA